MIIPILRGYRLKSAGTRLIVHIKENDGIKEDIQTDSTPRDIVATCSGVDDIDDYTGRNTQGQTGR